VGSCGSLLDLKAHIVGVGLTVRGMLQSRAWPLPVGTLCAPSSATEIFTLERLPRLSECLVPAATIRVGLRDHRCGAKSGRGRQVALTPECADLLARCPDSRASFSQLRRDIVCRVSWRQNIRARATPVAEAGNGCGPNAPARVRLTEPAVEAPTWQMRR